MMGTRRLTTFLVASGVVLAALVVYGAGHGRWPAFGSRPCDEFRGTTTGGSANTIVGDPRLPAGMEDDGLRHGGKSRGFTRWIFRGPSERQAGRTRFTSSRISESIQATRTDRMTSKLCFIHPKDCRFS